MKKILGIFFLIFFFSPASFAGSDDVEKMTKSEIETLLVGNTYPLGGKTLKKSKGAFYFSSVNDLVIIWKGKKGTGTWAADDKSQFCYTQTLWSGKECIMLKRNKKDGGYLHIFDGQTRKLKDNAIEQGNKLNKLSN